MSDIRKCLDYLFSQGEVFEVCLLGASGKHRLWDNDFAGRQVIAGWFDDKDKAIEIIKAAEKDVKPTAIYTTLNPCNPALLGRACNRLKVVKTRTTDKEIAVIKHLLIDVDPKRPAGVSSTDEELEAALVMCRAVFSELKKRGWTDPWCSCSGNGYHLIYRVEGAYPEIIRAFLNGLSARFSTPAISIDTTVFNPARLVKISGTTARKGDDIPTRPHRLSKVLSCPIPLPTAVDCLLPFVEEDPQPEKKNGIGGKLDVMAYLSRYGIPVVGEKRHGTATMYLLERCVFDDGHTGKEAAIMQDDSGKLLYQCFHDSCQGKTWHDARQIISGSDYIQDSASNASNASNASRQKSYQQCQHVPAECQQDASKDARDYQIAGHKSAEAIKKSLYQEIKAFILENKGITTSYDMDSEFNLRTREEKNLRAQVLRNLKNQGLIEKHGVKTGHWRVKNDDCEVMDLFAASPDPVPLPLPLGISDHIKIYPKSIIVIAGSSNAGKSAFAAGIAFATHAQAGRRDINNKIQNYTDNAYQMAHEQASRADLENEKTLSQLPMADLQTPAPPEFINPATPAQQMAKTICPEDKEIETWYFNSEASAEELRERWSKYPGGLEAFRNVKPVFRSKDFQDVIRPNAINIIDYLEVYDNFWETGGFIREIFDKLDKGIAIILIQKKTGAAVGRGGDFTVEKARLYVSLENNAPHGQICKIVKAKSFTDYNFNPNGMELDFKLIGGWRFQPISGWRSVSEKDRAAINVKYNIDANLGNYAFEFHCIGGEVVGLNNNDYQHWADQYTSLDLAHELTKIQRSSRRKPWMSKKNWFFELRGCLSKMVTKQAGGST